jgi:hypothetical protein
MVRFRPLAAMSLFAISLVGIARADIVFELKNDPQPDEQNILFKRIR